MCLPGQPCWQNTSNNLPCNGLSFTWFPCGCSPIKINSTDVIYTGNPLPNSLIDTNDNLTLALAKLDSVISSGSGGVPNTRTITINGLTQDLSVDRTWNVGDLLSSGSYVNPSWITSLAYSKITGVPAFITLTSLSAGTGISYNNLTGVITNSAPDQTVTLTQGANVTITGTYPNFTIAASGGGGGGWAVTGTTTITGDTNQTGAFRNIFNLDQVFVNQNNITGAALGGAFIVNLGTNTNVTATESVHVAFNLNQTVQFTGSTGFPVQEAFQIQAPTYAFVSATGTIVDTATVSITGAPIKGANIAITNTHGLLIRSGAVSTATNSFGLTVNAQTGATNNYSAQFIGGLGVIMDGQLTLGSSTNASSLQTIQAGGSGSNVNLSIKTKGTGGITLQGSVINILDATGSNGAQVDPGAGVTDFKILSSALGIQLFAASGGNLNLLTVNGNFAFSTSANPNFQSGVGIIYIRNNTSVPTGNPSGGGYLYVDSGALKYRGSSGTITTIANA